MARFELIIPDDVIKDIEKISKNADEIFGGMTKAAADMVASSARGACPNSKLASHIKVTKTYKTPSDHGINNKVYISGYIPFSGNRKSFSRSGRSGMYTTTKGIPAPFLANMYEYGRSDGTFPRKPFFWTAFKTGMIEAVMKKKQKELSGGILDE